MRDDYFVMFNRGEEQYQVSCPLGSATFNNICLPIVSNLDEIPEYAAARFLLRQVIETGNRKGDTSGKSIYMQRMPDFATEDYIFFKDGEVYYGAWVVNPKKWCILAKDGHRLASEMPHSDTREAESDLKNCLLLSGITCETEPSEQGKAIHEIAYSVKIVKYGIAFKMEEEGIRAIPLGWPGEYALLDDDGKVSASTLGEERLERMKTAYLEVKDIWLCRK